MLYGLLYKDDTCDRIGVFNEDGYIYEFFQFDTEKSSDPELSKLLPNEVLLAEVHLPHRQRTHIRALLKITLTYSLGELLQKPDAMTVFSAIYETEVVPLIGKYIEECEKIHESSKKKKKPT